MQEKLPADPPPDPAGGAYSTPQTPSWWWWGGSLTAPIQLTLAVGPLDLASPVPPLQNCAPT